VPKILERLVSQLKAKGMPENKAYAVATAQQQKAGNLKAGTTELTPKGAKRQAMGAAGRAKDRQASYDNAKPSDYSYNPRTNRATKRKLLPEQP
jgi:hypothetical protein